MPVRSPPPPRPPCSVRARRGFTLVELAIVLVIVALLGGGLMVSLGAQQEIRKTDEIRQQLETAREALLGFAAARGRLPCPATPGSNGRADLDDGTSNCAVDAGGNYFLPAATLGLGPTDRDGFLIDAWGYRVRYQLTTRNNFAFAKTNGMKSTGMAALDPDLEICPNSACATKLATGAVAVIVSVGRNGGSAPVGSDEQENQDGDNRFVSRNPGPDGAGRFDDSVLWLSPNVLYSKLIAAGQLP